MEEGGGGSRDIVEGGFRNRLEPSQLKRRLAQDDRIRVCYRRGQGREWLDAAMQTLGQKSGGALLTCSCGQDGSVE